MPIRIRCSPVAGGCRRIGTIRRVSAKVVNVSARKNGGHLIDYGKPYGYLPLRQHLCVLLGDIEINVQAPQILLTTAASQALDLLIRLLMKQGDTALVDDPGYYNLFGILRLHGIE